MRLITTSVVLWIGCVSCQMDLIPKQPGNQVVCDPGQFGFEDFYGFTVQHQITLHRPLEHHTRISLCQGGAPEGFDAYRPLPLAFHQGFKGDDLVWGQKICTMDMSGNKCYMLARRREYALRRISLYYPDLWIGGMYLCPGEEDDDGLECNNANAIPLRPLLSSDPWNSWWEMPDGRHYVQRIPLVQTLDDPTDIRFPALLPPDDWHERIDVNEVYEYDKDEKQSSELAELQLHKTWFDIFTQSVPVTENIILPVNSNQQYPLVHYMSQLSHNQSLAFLKYAHQLYASAIKYHD